MRDVSTTRQHAVLDGIKANLIEKCGATQAERYMHPLYWYLGSNRMPLNLLAAFCATTPKQQAVIANRLAKGGSDQEVIDWLKRHLLRGKKGTAE